MQPVERKKQRKRSVMLPEERAVKVLLDEMDRCSLELAQGKWPRQRSGQRDKLSSAPHSKLCLEIKALKVQRKNQDHRRAQGISKAMENR